MVRNGENIAGKVRPLNNAKPGIPGDLRDIKFAAVEGDCRAIIEDDEEWVYRTNSIPTETCTPLKPADAQKKVEKWRVAHEPNVDERLTPFWEIG